MYEWSGNAEERCFQLEGAQRSLLPSEMLPSEDISLQEDEILLWSFKTWLLLCLVCPWHGHLEAWGWGQLPVLGRGSAQPGGCSERHSHGWCGLPGACALRCTAEKAATSIWIVWTAGLVAVRGFPEGQLLGLTQSAGTEAPGDCSRPSPLPWTGDARPWYCRNGFVLSQCNLGKLSHVGMWYCVAGG